MNIKILDSWLREYLKTKATPQKIAEVLSLTSVSVEKLEKIETDFVYDIEVTTNRVDLMSIIGLAREAATALSQFGISSSYISVKDAKQDKKQNGNFPITIVNNPKLVNRICAVVMDVDVKDSPSFIKKRLEATGIRSLNNLIDITNYIMREIGHPTHVFDFDRLDTKKLIIRESKKGETIVTLDQKKHVLLGGDIVAEDGKGEIVDLLGVMGTANSIVRNDTKRILFFVDNNEPSYIRKTSMSLGIRSEAAVLNKKGVDPELAIIALTKGIELFEQYANGKQISPILDIYQNIVKQQTVILEEEKISEIIGIPIPQKNVYQILTSLGFGVKNNGKSLQVTIPSWRRGDVTIPVDLIEEIARIYGYQRLPTIIPPLTVVENYYMENDSFYWERRAKEALKYWGFIEVYSYSIVSEALLEGPTNDAIELVNPLTEDMVYMRKTLVPNLLQVVKENKTKELIKIFEIANIYRKVSNNLPHEIPMLAAVLKKDSVSFYEVKGIIEQLFADLGIKDVSFEKKKDGGEGAEIFIKKENIGNIEILQSDIIDFELNFAKIFENVSLKKTYKPVSKYPPIIEDVRIIIDPQISYKEITSIIKKQSSLVAQISLLDVFENKKTFRITYQHKDKTLTDEEVGKEREKIYKALGKLGAQIS